MELVEIGTSAGVGIIDNILVELEERGQITGNLTYVKDVIRIGGAIGGLAYNYMVAKPGAVDYDISEALALSTLPLAFHSIRNLVKKFALSYELVTVPQAPAIVQQPVAPAPASRLQSY